MRTIDDKKYVPVNVSRGKRYAKVNDLIDDTFTEEEQLEINQLRSSTTLSAALSQMRIKAGISQVMMAEALGCAQPRISVIESNTNKKTSMDTILRYVSVTRLPFKAVLEDGRVITISSPTPALVNC